MTNTPSPINLALNAVYQLFFESSQTETLGESSNSLPKLKAYTDDSSRKLEELVENLNAKGVPYPVLIRMGTKEAKKREPYAKLLEQMLRDRRLGVSGSIHSIVTELLKINQSSIERKFLQGFTKSNELKAGDIEIYIKTNSVETHQTAKNREKATQSLLNWAHLESYLDVPKTTIFSRLIGGIRPIVYVFDDYNNFIVNSQEDFYRQQTPTESDRKEVITDNIKEFYGRSSSSNAPNLESAIKGFGRCLNTLSLVFNIKAPDIKFNGDRTNRYAIVAEKLDFQRLDQERNQIAAFIIDLEWLPCPQWIDDNPKDIDWGERKPEEMGHIAIRLLTQRYPEIPCFVFTGLWSIEILQKSLAAGAAWCFQKPTTHHIASSSDPNYQPEEELNYFNLDYHLVKFAERNYGAYQELHNPEQAIKNSLFESLQNSSLFKDLQNKEAIELLFAKQFTAKTIEITKRIDAGKTSAITLFIKPKNGEIFEATRFVKIDSWFNIQKEYLAYQHNIRPVLNNHVAHVIQPPSFYSDKATSNPVGMLVSTLAGFPEDYGKLKSLQTLMDQYLSEADGAATLSRKILTTLNFVLLPLYQNAQTHQFWIGEEFAPRYTGELVSINDSTPMVQDEPTNKSNQSAEMLLEYLDSNCNNNTSVLLQDWQIERIWPASKKRDGSEVGGIDLYHSELKAQVEIFNISAEEINRRFAPPTVRHRMNVSFQVKLKINDFKEKKDFLKAGELLNAWKNLCKKEELLDPYDIFNYKNSKIEGHFATTHGDLNMHNILYPDNEDAGFLIDFFTAKKDGLIAYDLARLEVNIWTEYLMPIIEFIIQNTLGNEEEVDLSSGYPDVYRFLHLALEFVDNRSYSAWCGSIETFKWKLNKISKCQDIPDSILVPLINSLETVSCIRSFMKEKLSISMQSDEFKYAMSVVFLRYSQFKFESRTYPASDTVINTLCYLCSVHYFNGLSFVSK